MKHDLSSLQRGKGARIDTLITKEPLRRRLFDLGFTPGAGIRCLFAVPGGDPRAYLIRDTVIALRNVDAKTILMEE